MSLSTSIYLPLIPSKHKVTVKILKLHTWIPVLQETFHNGSSSRCCIILPPLALVAICIVTDALNDQATRKVLPHACALHFECNDPVSSSNVVSVFSRFHHCVSGGNKPEMDNRIKW